MSRDVTPGDSASVAGTGEGPIRSPMEAHGSYRGADWSPQRLVFHQNLESFAERVGLIVALQSNGKLSQEQAYARIRRMWKQLRASREELLETSRDRDNGAGEGTNDG